MADKQSREEVAYESLKSDFAFYLSENEPLTDEQKLEKLRSINERIRGVTYVIGMDNPKVNRLRESVQEGMRELLDRLNNNSDDKNLTIGITADVSNALKGLKAIQRETRETIKGLKELETYQEVDERGVARKLSEEIKKFEWRVRGIE